MGVGVYLSGLIFGEVWDLGAWEEWDLENFLKIYMSWNVLIDTEV
jgi:hypothetical protein